MKKFLTICAFVAATLSLTGCAGVANTVSNNLTQTQVVLSDDNFKVIGHAYGEATALKKLTLKHLQITKI